MNRILVVEDNDDNYLLIEEILSRFDISLSRAATGKEFYSILSKTTEFHLILMDLMLPDTDGIELAKYVIKNHIQIPIVFISAYSERCDEIFELGIEYFLTKPIMRELFLSVISKFIAL
jgi:two-component system, OmpR family, response regulator